MDRPVAVKLPSGLVAHTGVAELVADQGDAYHRQILAQYCDIRPTACEPPVVPSSSTTTTTTTTAAGPADSLATDPQ
ncbi:MAG: hypothetical protein QOJ23_5965 [Actinomycetota bacterium]|nr:hypothetical protein [Actinomycetota bacterium]